ncbi:MAG: hypothetical protein C4B59_06800 [Candidatus Methanogaster sp.]|uniref:Uncharacterized protein n=1 Tax=Candidatus Methanogaster sp. TaxID=3386292 RepID=A0AC61L2K4_9EURY|nr:MAG: hypothetical protein C4B59_06800 [ANME-2 cluster archaeon]
MEVCSFDQAQHELGGSNQAKYVCKYAKDINVNTVVIEEKYIDKDYLIDFSKSHARSFDTPSTFTKRLHFFSEKFSTEDFKEALVNCGETYLGRLGDSYLGFVVVKPINDINGNPFIGRTILKTYQHNITQEYRYFIHRSYSTSLYGISFGIDSLPFQAQDMAVGACATAALWTSLHPSRNLFGIPSHSPAEITEISVSFPHENRNFPSSGLTVMQMINYIHLIGLEAEVINIGAVAELNSEIGGYMVSDAAKAYIKAGLPLIATLRLKNDKNITGRHAAVISGYRCDQNGHVKELYVHDDQIGPYSRVMPDGNFIRWKNEWIDNFGYDEVSVEKLLIPIYPKIRLAFGHIYNIYLKDKQKAISEGLDIEIYLTQVKDYKRFLLNKSIKDKEIILTNPLPRFLWIIRTYYDQIPAIDDVYDGTAVFPKKLRTIRFLH